MSLALAAKHLHLPQIYVTDTLFSPLEYIFYPHGYLLFSNTSKDTMFLTHKDALPYIAAILSYYFSEDTIERYPEFKKIYSNFIIDNVHFSTLSSKALDMLENTSAITLIRDPEGDDPKLTFIGFDPNTLLEDMFKCQQK